MRAVRVVDCISHNTPCNSEHQHATIQHAESRPDRLPRLSGVCDLQFIRVNAESLLGLSIVSVSCKSMSNLLRESRESPKIFQKSFLLLSVLLCAALTDAYHLLPARQRGYIGIRSLGVGSRAVMQRSSKAKKSSPPLLKCQRVTQRKGGEDDEQSLYDNDYFRSLAFRYIVKEKNAKTEKNENTFIGSNNGADQTYAGLIKYFVPGFVAIWAAGYGAVFLAEISGNGLGDTGGFIGAGLAVFLLLALVGAAGYEVFKPLPNETTI